MPKSRVFQLAAVVLIGRDSPIDTYANGPSSLAVGPINRLIEKEHHVQVFVRDNNVDQALKALKKKMSAKVSSAR